MTRTWASSTQTVRLGFYAWSKQIGSIKGWLEPSKYCIKGTNYRYQEVAIVKETIQTLEEALREGKLKWSKSKGFYTP